jgi:hypothetical protein
VHPATGPQVEEEDVAAADLISMNLGELLAHESEERRHAAVGSKANTARVQRFLHDTRRAPLVRLLGFACGRRGDR